MPVAKKDQCGKCLSNLTKTSGGILCKACFVWYHAACVNVADGDIAALREHKSLSFVCPGCLEKPPESDSQSVRSEISLVNAKMDLIIRKTDEERLSTRQMMTDLMTEFKQEISSSFKEIKSDVENCFKLVGNIETQTNKRMSAFDVHINILHKRLNRHDIIVSGLPSGMADLFEVVISLGAVYGIAVNRREIDGVYYVNNGKALMVKFTSFALRDSIVEAYYKTIKTMPLTISKIIPGLAVDGLNSRVFLNDHFPPAANKLNAVCMKLRREKKISKFRIKNSDIPVAILNLPDGKEVKYDITGCEKLLAGDDVSS